ncbi:MAG: hypothetical protein ISS80_02935 [Candidatus Cloacimonetes bacterium]|nr:hypothetical protein [Candidatus Cloacimonadota bacterium]MBL7149007.1 hypothetical protein [Candidatus Cloacimonadota bacterium]
MKKIFIILILVFSITLCLAWEVVAISYNNVYTSVYLIAGTYRVTVEGYISYTLPWDYTNTYYAFYELRNSGGTQVQYESGYYNTLYEWQTGSNYDREVFQPFELTTSGTYTFRGAYIASWATTVNSTSATLFFDDAVPPGNDQD